MNADQLVEKLQKHKRDQFDFHYHFDKISSELYRFLQANVYDPKLTTYQRLINSITWEGIIYTSLLIFVCIICIVWGAKILFSEKENKEYNQCVFTAIERLQSSADIISLCKEFKK